MLKITVSIIPGGFGPERKLGELHITNVAGGTLADYECILSADDLERPVTVRLRRYPRWSASVWDLVARALAKGLGGRERLPRRPKLPAVAVRRDPAGIAYVRVSDIPEPARTAFERRMLGATAPMITDEADCVYAEDWLRFISLRERP